MATFSYGGTAKQLYVAKSVVSAFTSATALGAIDLGGNAAGFYILHQGPVGVTRSDIIATANVTSATVTRATAMDRTLTRDLVTLTANGGVPVAGQDYILRFTFYEYGSQSYADQYFKHAAVRATTGMTATQLYTALVKSIKLNFSRETVPMITARVVTTSAAIPLIVNSDEDYTFKLDVGAGDTTAAITGNVVSLATEAAGGAALSAQNIIDLNAALAAAGIDAVVVSGTAPAADVADATAFVATGILIEEIEQPWVLGTKQSDALKFTVTPDEITVSGALVAWGTSVAETTGLTTIGNGRNMADLEYFYAGEKGDQYRNVGWPYVMPTTYLVDPTLTYDVIDINYFYVGEGISSQRSQKCITLLVPYTANAATLTNPVLA